MNLATKTDIGETKLDLPLGWIDLSNRVRRRINGLQNSPSGLSVQNELNFLADDVDEICARFEALYAGAQRLVEQHHATAVVRQGASPDSADMKEQRAAIEIQQEEHEKSGGPLDVIKALLMWRDTPDERVQEMP